LDGLTLSKPRIGPGRERHDPRAVPEKPLPDLSALLAHAHGLRSEPGHAHAQAEPFVPGPELAHGVDRQLVGDDLGELGGARRSDLGLPGERDLEPTLVLLRGDRSGPEYEAPLDLLRRRVPPGEPY